MKIVVTGAQAPFGADLIARLAADHAVTVLDPEPVELAGVTVADPGDWSQERLGEVLAEQEAVIHAALHDPRPLRDLPPDHALLDLGSRLSYNLVLAAHKAGVRRCILVTSLELFAAYDPDLILTEAFRPLPSTDPRHLAFHLVEALVTEARRDLEYRGLYLARVGQLVREDAVAAGEYDRLWVDPRDVAAALAALVVAEEPQRWPRRRILHLCADRPDALASAGAQKHWLQCPPQHNFGYVAPEVTA